MQTANKKGMGNPKKGRKKKKSNPCTLKSIASIRPRLKGNVVFLEEIVKLLVVRLEELLQGVPQLRSHLVVSALRRV